MLTPEEVLISSYPRERPKLSERHAQLYVAEYSRNRSGGKGLPGVVADLESWMHRVFASHAPGRRIMELGAGTLNHLCYENDYKLYDIIEPFSRPMEK